MNHVYKVVWSKAKNCYVVASELAKRHTKSAGSSAMNRTLVAGVLACVLSCGAVFPAYAAGDPVTYDDASKESITLQGPTGTGTKLTGLADGELSAASTDAVTGAQLYATQQQFDDFQSALSRNNTSIARAQTDINNIKSANIVLQSDVNTLKTQVETGFNVTIGGAKIKTVNPDSNFVNFVAGKGISITNDNGSVKLDVFGDGVIAAGDAGAITGGVAYTELRPTADGTYVKNAQTTAANLTALDTQVKTNTDDIAGLKDMSNLTDDGKDAIRDLAKGSVKVVAGTHTTVTEGVDGEATTYAVNVATDGTVADGDTGIVTGDAVYDYVETVKNTQDAAVQAELAIKANVDASNVGMNMAGDGITDEQKTANATEWGKALGIGEVADGNEGLVTGGTMFNELRPTDGTYVKNNQTTAENLGALDTQVKTNTDNIESLQKMENITDAGKEVIRELSKEAVKVVNGEHTTVTEGTDGNAKTYAVNVTTDGAVADGNTGIVTGDTVYDYVETVKDAQDAAVQAELAAKANVDASNIGKNLTGDGVTDADKTANAVAWGEALGSGVVADGNSELIVGGTLFDEVRPVDGEYVKNAQTTAENLGALDTQVKTNADDIAGLKDMSNLSDDGKDAIRDLAKGSVKVVAGTHTTVTEGTDGDATTYAFNVTTDGQIADGNEGVVSGGTVYQYVKDATDALDDSIQTELDTKANKDASNIGMNMTGDGVTDEQKTANATAWGEALGSGAVASGDKQLITGGTMYSELRPASDGTYVKGNQTTAENLGALDTALAQAVTNINGTLGNVVYYDNEAKDTVTFGGGTAGTKLADVKSGTLSRSSMEAVNGAQLWATEQKIAGFAADITRNKNNISNLNTSVTAALESVSASSQLVDTVNNIKADTSLNNLSAAGRQVIKTAAANAVQEYMANQSSNNPVNTGLNTNYYTINVADLIDDLGTPTDPNASVATDANAANGNTNDFDPASMLGTSLRTNPGTNTNYVVYDDATAGTITLEGATGTGTKITNLADGELSAASTDAVTGAQLYATQQQFDEFQSALSTNNTSIARAQTDINNIKTTNINLQSDVNTLKTQMENGFNVTIAGAKVKTVNPDSNYVDFVAGDNVQITNDNESVKISVPVNGRIASGDTGIVSGGTVYNETRLTEDGAYAKTGKSAADNITALDSQVKANATAIEDLQGAVGGDVSSLRRDLDKKAEADASNVGKNATTDNSELWGEALGTGAVASGDKKLVTGDTVYKSTHVSADGTYVKVANDAGQNFTVLDRQMKVNTDAIADLQDAVGGDLSGLRDEVASKANADASNVAAYATQWGEAVGTGTVTAGDKKMVSGDTVAKETRLTEDANYAKADKSAADNIKALDTQVKKNADDVSAVKSDVDTLKTDMAGVKDGINGLDGRVTTLENGLNGVEAIKTDVNGLKSDMAKKANADASNVAANTAKWGAAIGTGKVLENNGELVTGGTVYQALQDFTVSKEDIENAMADKLSGKLDKNLGNIDDEGKQVIRDTVKADLDKKANTDASNIDVQKWAEKLGTGEIAEGNTGLVNGSAVYEAIQSVNGTDLIGRDKEAGAIRIGAKASYDELDSVDFSKSDGSSRVLRGVKTDARDATSVANVGYVDSVAGQIANAVNSGFNEMHDKVNKVGANAAAMASLMPAPMDGDEKWSLSAAIGNYRSATAGAVGVFYKPQDNVILNVRGSFGSEENMIGGGVSVALNRGNKPSVSKAQLVRAVNAQATRLTEQNQIIQAQSQKIMELEQRMNAMMSNAK